MCSTVDDIVIATTTNKSDDKLVEWADNNHVPCFRGSEDDVLQRVLDAHKYMESDIIVEITGDCPFTDPDIVDVAVETFRVNDCDYLTNCEIQSAPPGLFVQVFTLESLIEIGQTVLDPAVREHVSLYYYENPQKYQIHHLMSSPKWKLPLDTRIYLDYPEDLDFLRAVHSYFSEQDIVTYGANELVELLNARPALLDINRHLTDIAIRYDS
jgi:spore coat polysaccharide biosynthesis protein SpsF